MKKVQKRVTWLIVSREREVIINVLTKLAFKPESQQKLPQIPTEALVASKSCCLDPTIAASKMAAVMQRMTLTKSQLLPLRFVLEI